MNHRVTITEDAEAEILAFGSYVADVKLEPVNAGRLLEAIYDSIATLRLMPRRCSLAPENDTAPFEVRMLVVKRSLLILFTIDDADSRVTVIGFRHGSHLPLDLSDRLT